MTDNERELGNALIRDLMGFRKTLDAFKEKATALPAGKPRTLIEKTAEDLTRTVSEHLDELALPGWALL